MCHFSGSRFFYLYNSVKDNGILLPLDCSIRNPPDQSFFPAPRRLSQVCASFFAYRCQGIHQQPLATWSKFVAFAPFNYFFSWSILLKRYFISVKMYTLNCFKFTIFFEASPFLERLRFTLNCALGILSTLNLHLRWLILLHYLSNYQDNNLLLNRRRETM